MGIGNQVAAYWRWQNHVSLPLMGIGNRGMDAVLVASALVSLPLMGIGNENMGMLDGLLN